MSVRGQVPGTTCNGGTHQQCEQQLPDLGLRKGARVLRSTTEGVARRY